MSNQTKKANWWDRTVATYEDLDKTFERGLLKGVEGIADAGMGVVGFIGGLFSDDFKKTMQKAIQYDVTGYLTEDTQFMNWVDAIAGGTAERITAINELINGKKTLEKEREASYLSGNKAGEFIQEGVESIAHMAPGVALSFVPGAGPALSMAYTGFSTGGGSMEQALTEGADYDSALAYGALSGGIEAGMEKLGGYAFGGGKSLTGKLFSGTKFGNWLSKGVGKAVETAVSEGLEEGGSALLDPVNKWITGVDTDIGANFRQALNEMPKTLAMGATVGSVMQGGQVIGQNIANKGRGGAKATRADSFAMQFSELNENYGADSKQNRKTQKAQEALLRSMSYELQGMDEASRKKYLENSPFKTVFNSEDGTVKLDLTRENTNSEAVSKSIGVYSGTFDKAPITNDEVIGEGARATKNYIEKMLGKNARVIITSDYSKDTNAAFSPNEGVFYVNNNATALSKEQVARQVAIHEITHYTEGTKQYYKMVDELTKVILDSDAPTSVKNKIGSLAKRMKAIKNDYKSDTEGMNDALKKYVYQTEGTADLIGDLLADEKYITRIAERDQPFVKKLLAKIKALANKSAKVDKDATKYLNKLVKSFEKAIDNAHGGVRLSQIGDDEDENVDFLDEKRYNKVGGKYSQYRSLAMQWAKATNTKKGSTKLLYNADNDTWNLICADNSEMGYSEIITYTASSKNVEAVMVEDGENGSYTEKQKNDSSIYESAEIYRAESSIESNDNTYDANQGTDGRDGAFYSGKSSSNRNGNIGKSKGNSRLSKKKLIRIRFDDEGNVIEEIRHSKNRSYNPNDNVDDEKIPRINEKDIFVEDKYFKSQMAKWETLKHGSYVKVGVIGEKHPLYSIGMPKGILRYDVDKLNKNMTKHSHYLTVELLNIIPKIIANPVAIARYSEENTVNIFGDFFVGKSPMMVAITISQNRARNSINKIRTYNARRDIEKLITDETILYLDKNRKRTRQWFQACGIQVPLGGTKFGFICSISQKNKNVNQNIENVAGNSNKRKSVNRSYNPLENIDDEGNIWTEEENGGIKIDFNDKVNDNSNDFEIAERERKAALDSLVNGEAPAAQSYVQDETRLLRQVVNNTKAKKFTPKEIKSFLDELLSKEGYYGDNFVALKGKKRTEVEKMLWNKLNSAKKGELGGAALDIADYIIKNTIATEYTEITADVQLAVQFIEACKPYLHNMNLNFIKGDIKAKFDKDKTPYLMWAVKKDSSFRGYTPDEMAQELAELGFNIEKTSEADIFLEINELYRLARQTVTEAVPTKETLLTTLGAQEAQKLKQKLAKDILVAHEERGTETSFYKLQQKYIKKIDYLANEVKTIHRRETLERLIIKEATKIKDSKKHTFANATQFQTDALKDIKSLLARVNSREQVNRTSLRAIMNEFSRWYDEKNPVLKCFYSDNIAEHLAYFVQENASSNSKKEAPLSISELESVHKILHHMNHIFENYGKIWRGGKYVEALVVAKEYFKRLEIAERDVPALVRRFLNSPAMRYINDPMSVFAAWDGYDEDGFFTQTYREFAFALIKQKHDEMTALAELVQFEKENKKYMKQLVNGKSTVTVAGKINAREVKVETIEMPKYAAIDLYMMSRTGNAIETFEKTGYTLKLDNEHVKEEFQPITKEQIEAMYKEFSEQDKQLIKILDKAYNGFCRDLKYETDMQRLGFTNVLEGVYYPLCRINSVDFDKSDFKSVMDRVSNISSNHNRVRSKNAFIVSNAITKFMRHVNDVTRYANLSIPMDNLNILFNLDVGDNARKPTSVRTKLEKNNLWENAEIYLYDLASDTQGVGDKFSSGSKAIAWMRASYAKYQLGANPKVWFSQLSSYFAAFGELEITSLTKAFNEKGTYKDSEVDKYCKLAAVRNYEKGAFSAMAVTDKIGEVGDFFTKPIEFVDRRVVCALFSACQYEAQSRYKLDIGTEENKIKAGEILTEVILKTQQNQLVTEQSSAMREKSEIVRAFTMFSADSMKLNSRFVQCVGELATINKKLKDAKKDNNSTLIEELTKRKKSTIRKLSKYSAAIIVIAFYMAALAKAVRAFRRKDDEDESVGEWLFKEAGLNLLGNIPFFRDAVSFFSDGFEADIFAISMVNDVLNATEEIKNNFADMANGKEVTSQKWFATGRKAANAIGQIAGIPTRNIYNEVTGWIRRADEGAGLAVDSIFKESSDSELKSKYKEAIESGNNSLANQSLELIYKNHGMELSDQVLKREIDRLNNIEMTKDGNNVSNYGVIAKKSPQTLDINGEVIELTAKDKNTFKTAYITAGENAGKMARVYKYKSLTDESKAYSLRKVYEYHYLKAEESLTGEKARLVYFADVIGIDKLALIIGYANSLKGDKDRKKKIEAYIKSMGLISQHASLALRYLGYSDSANDSKVKNFISVRSSLTSAQKAEFLEMLKLRK